MTQALDEAGALLQAGRAAYERHEWGDAARLLGEADRTATLDAEDLQRLGDAHWWLWRLDEAIAIRERAFGAFVKADRRPEAAVVALQLVVDYASRLDMTLAQAFMRRAEELLAEEPEGAAHAHLAGMQGVMAVEMGDYEAGLALGRRASVLGATHGDPDRETMGLLVQGKALIGAGQVAEGLALLDQATVRAVTGELSPLATGIIYCNTIETCASLGDWERAGSWTEAAQRWCERHADSGFPGICRVHQAEVLRFRGDWAGALESAVQASEQLGAGFGMVGMAYYEIGEIRLRQGDLDGAEQAFTTANEYMRTPEPGLSLLKLEQGRPAAALTSMRRTLGEDGQLTPLTRARILPGAVEVALAAEDLDTATTWADELDALAETYENPSPFLRASAQEARGRLLLAQGDPHGALRLLNEALRGWQGQQLPFESARARQAIGRALKAAGDPDGAQLELRAARAAFERLGAEPETRRTSALLAELERGDTPLEPSQRREVRTFLFTDIVSSTSLIEAIGDDAWADLVRWHDQTLRACFSAHNGQEVDHAGDGFFVAFPDAACALDAAVTVQRRLRDHRREHGFAPRVRIGVHTAESVVDDEGYTGRGVHEAARIGALAGPGEIVVSGATLAAAGDDRPASPPRQVTLKGISEPVQVVTLDWE